MKKFGLILSIATLVALIFGAANFFNFTKREDIQTKNGSTDHPINTTEVIPSVSEISNIKESISTTGRVAESPKFNTEMAKLLSAEVASTKNLKAFYDKHKNDTSSEGQNYAWLAIGACISYVGQHNVANLSAAEHSPQFKERIAASKEMLSRCEGFSDYNPKLYSKELTEANNKAKANPGALQTAQKAGDLYQKGEFEEANRLTKLIIDSKDPDAIWAVAENLMPYWLIDENTKGKYHGLLELRPAAFKAVTCEMGHLSCAKDSFVRLSMCAESDVCRTLEEEMSMDQATAEQKNLFEQAKQDILQAINSGDYRQLGLPGK